MRMLLTVAAFAVVINTAYAAVFYRSVRRARFRAIAALRDVRPFSARPQIQNASDTLISLVDRLGRCEKSVCFAYEGSSDVSRDGYSLQQRLAAMTSAIVSADNAATFSAMQYATTTTSIATPTVDFYAFLEQVQVAGPDRADNVINMSAALGACAGQMLSDESKQGVIVIIGSGRSNSGFNPDIVAQEVPDTTSIIAVTTSEKKMLFEDSLGVSRNSVISLTSLSDLATALNILVPKVCF